MGDFYVCDVCDVLIKVFIVMFSFCVNLRGGLFNFVIFFIFGVWWLVLRFLKFVVVFFDIMINLMIWLVLFDFVFDSVDVVIYFGFLDWSGVEFEYLMDELVILVCSFELFDCFVFVVVSDLFGVLLLYFVFWFDVWE